MGGYNTMFWACIEQVMSFFPPEWQQNETAVTQLCEAATRHALDNHRRTGVLDFEDVVSVNPAWWINGVCFTMLYSITAVLNLLSIFIFCTASMRSPTNILLAVITAFDFLTFTLQVPLNTHTYLLEHYRELPPPIWCRLYNYVHNFLPSAFHSAAFLLNMYVSIQRCVGVKDVSRCQILGTFKGVYVAIATCTVISFSIHSMYPITLGVEEVRAVSKKVLSAQGFLYVKSCRVLPRNPEDYQQLFSVYLWLRVAVLQILPALVLCICNITLIRVACKTYSYRKQLIGAVGVFAPSSYSETNDASFTKDASKRNSCNGMTDVQNRDSTIRRISVETTLPTVSCDKENRRTLSNGGLIQFVNGIIHHRTSTVGVMPSASSQPSTSKCTDNNGQATLIGNGQNGEILINPMEADNVFNHMYTGNGVESLGMDNSTSSATDSGVVTPLEGYDNVLFNDHDQPGNTFANEHQEKNDQNASSKAGNNLEDDELTHQGWNGTSTNCYTARSENHISDSGIHKPVHRSSQTLQDLERVNKPYTTSEKITEENGKLSLWHFLREDSTKSIPQGMKSKRPSAESVISSRQISVSYRTSLSSRSQSLIRTAAELRSSIMLILVTSCTLLAEIFVIILLVFKYVTSVVLTQGQFISHDDLATLIMISNLVTIITFPLNFAFFYGLSRAFRYTVRQKVKILFTRCSRRPM